MSTEEESAVLEEYEDEEEESLEDILADSIENTNIATIISSGSSDSQVRVRLRVSNQNRWKYALELILREEHRCKGAWNLHVCQHYLLFNKRLVYTWEFIVQSDDLDSAVRDISRMFDLIRSNISLFKEKEEVMRPKSSPMATNKQNRIFGELEEYPLRAPQDRNRLNSKGKGARGLAVQ